MPKSPTKTPETKLAGKNSGRPPTRRAPGPDKAQVSPRAPVETATTGRSSKLDLMADLLRRPDGASVSELAGATGWQSHSVRGAMSGALKRKVLTVTSEVIDGVRRYRIGTPA